jgi:hypothetical protein
LLKSRLKQMYSAFLRRDVPGILVDLDDDTASKLLLIAEISTNRKSESGKATIENEGFRYLFWKALVPSPPIFGKDFRRMLAEIRYSPIATIPGGSSPKPLANFVPVPT